MQFLSAISSNYTNLDWLRSEVVTLKNRYNTRNECNGVQWGATNAMNARKPLTPLPSYISFWAKGLRLFAQVWNRGRAQWLLTARSQVRDPLDLANRCPMGRSTQTVQYSTVQYSTALPPAGGGFEIGKNKTSGSRLGEPFWRNWTKRANWTGLKHLPRQFCPG